jgi:exodeoxyribonuclease-5
MKLNHGQVEAVDRAVSGFLEKNLKGLTIIGEGGTGKTTCVMSAAERWLAAGLKVLFTAPTNKAVKQLEKAARQYGLHHANVGFQTLHSALGLAMLPDEDKKFAFRAGPGVFALYDIVVVDEASMIGKRALFDYLLPEAETQNVKLLLMGDDMQLPPVREQKSQAFEVFETIRLTKVERYDTSGDIGQHNAQLRAAIASDRPFNYVVSEHEGDIVAVKSAEFMKFVTTQFTAETDLDEQRVLAWRNSRVNEINRAIRQCIYGRGAERFETGERLVTGAPVRSGETTVLSTDEECTVHSVRDSSLEDEDSRELFKTHLLVLNPLHSTAGQVIVQVLHNDDLPRYTKRLEYLEAQAKKIPAQSRQFWKRFHNFKDLFAQMRYCYCITVHRSQGSTYKRVFVDVKDILTNNIRTERQNLLYVATSRPSQSLVTNKGKYVA